MTIFWSIFDKKFTKISDFCLSSRVSNCFVKNEQNKKKPVPNKAALCVKLLFFARKALKIQKTAISSSVKALVEKQWFLAKNRRFLRSLSYFVAKSFEQY